MYVVSMSVYIRMHYFILCQFQQDHVTSATKAMQPTQGRVGQYEEAELLAEEIGHFRARRVVSDAVYSQWIYVSL